MARRTMTLRRIDPWSVLKFGFVLNVCFLVVLLLGAFIIWFVIRQLGIIEQLCQLLIDVGFEECAVDGGDLFRVLLLFGVLGTVVLTGLAVFGAFLHNLLADLVGGITFGVNEEGGATATSRPRAASRPQAGGARSSSGAAGDSGSGSGSDTGSLGTPPTRDQQSRSPRRGTSGASEERPSWTPSSSGGEERLFGGGSSSGGDAPTSGGG